MAKLTLLDIVQRILSDMDSDEVNSIDDTMEAGQVADIVRGAWEAMMSNRNWPHQKRLLSLTPSGDDSLPTHMYVQESIKEMVSVKYNKARDTVNRREYRAVHYLEPDDFLRYLNGRNTDDADVDIIVDTTGIELLIRSDQAPTYFTSFDDTTLVFDSYDKDVDDTLQASKIQAVAYIMPEWVRSDDAIPDLPVEAFAALVEEATSRCFVRLKQQADQISATESRRQQAWLARKAWRVNGGVQYPNYGRGFRKYRRDPTFERDR